MPGDRSNHRDAKEGPPEAAAPVRFDFSDWRQLRSIRLLTGDVEGPRPCSVGYLERAAAAILLMSISPLMLLIALAIKIDSPRGPVFYRQVRVGLDRRRRAPESPGLRPDRREARGLGKPFEMYKFRTMIQNAEAGLGPVWATGNDPRVTRVGRVLRHLRLDELPQLLNVIIGEMRLIGPRPERPQFVDQLREEIPEYARRQMVPPGITGLAQVERNYDNSVDDVRRKVKYDLYYVKHRSKLLDLKIIMRTLDVMLRGRGAR